MTPHQAAGDNSDWLRLSSLDAACLRRRPDHDHLQNTFDVNTGHRKQHSAAVERGPPHPVHSSTSRPASDSEHVVVIVVLIGIAMQWLSDAAAAAPGGAQRGPRARTHRRIVERVHVIGRMPVRIHGWAMAAVGAEPLLSLHQVIKVFSLFCRDDQFSRLPPVGNLHVVLQPFLACTLLRRVVHLLVVSLCWVSCRRFVTPGARGVHTGGRVVWVPRRHVRVVVVVVVLEPAGPARASAHGLVLVLGLRPRRRWLCLCPIG
mmetsp:Transcript_48815/g.104184  ORF Transcript_48815/g.104184 Transcript_48815/m.104184 type:complete len:261 (-) Transcript_48815:562-1344(-)